MKFVKDLRELAPTDVIERAFTEKKYIITKHAVFQIHYSQAQQSYSAQRLVVTDAILTGKEYEVLTGRQVNNRLERQIVLED